MGNLKGSKSEKGKDTFKEEIIHQFHVISENIIDQVKGVAEGVATLNEKVERYREESKVENETTRADLSQAITHVHQELSRAIINVDQKLDGTREELKADIHTVDQKVDRTREELKAEIQTVDQKVDRTREELKAEIQGVRQEIKTEIQETRQELKTEIQETRQELKSEIQESKQEVLAATKFSYAELDKRLTTLEKEFLDLKYRFEKIESHSAP